MMLSFLLEKWELILVESPAYRHAQEAYVEGVISLTG